MEIKYVQDENLNKKVAETINELRDKIVNYFHPKSIILTGSFGRGEATVNEDGGCLQFLSDCEVIVIPNKYVFNKGKIKGFSEKFYEKTCLEVHINGVKLNIHLLLPFINRMLKPTIGNYELKYGSKVIYGKNYLERIPDFKPDDIPLWEGIRLLFNRMAEALEHFSLENPTDEMIYWTNKIVLACQDALLLSMGRYHHSYKIRNETFQEIFPLHYKDLDEQIPNFLPLTAKATEYKLNPNKKYSKNAVEFWFEVVEITDKVFRYIIEKDMGIKFNSYAEFQSAYLKHPYIKKKYYHGLLSNSIYQNLIIAGRVWIHRDNILTIKLTQKSMPPWTHLVYSMIPVVFFGSSEGGRIDKISLRGTREILSWFKKPEEQKRDSSEYEYVKEQVLYLWHCICY